MKNKLLPLMFSLLIPVSVFAAPPENSRFVAHLSGDAEVPLRESNATGQVLFELTGEGNFLAFRLIVANIDNVVASHIHLGPQGTNGGVVAFLYGTEPPGGGQIQGPIGVGMIDASDLVGTLAGQDLSVLVEALRTGGAYVNVHTNDGIGDTNTGPGDFPGGEVRGQIRPVGPKKQ